MHRYLRDHPATVLTRAVTAPRANPTVFLTLAVEVFGYGNRTLRKQLLDDIERLLWRYEGKTIRAGNEYRITVRYANTIDLEKQMADVWFQIEMSAEAHRCDVQGNP